mmetsp:Transcript_23871/g.51155  ORF Transcript_23871/g.51155 Transcript_23871/m.51155 type:complete len:209 (-) Transcript_23871:656-1282(-)
MLDGVLHPRALHLLFELLAQHSVQLLDIMLREGIHRVPPKGPGQVLGGHRVRVELHLVEEALQRQRQALVRQIRLLRRHVVHRLPEVREVEQGLQQRVHVARGPLVLEAHVAGLLPRVVRVVVVRLHLDLRLDGDRVVDQKTLLGVPKLLQAHELGEPPVTLLAVKKVRGVLPVAPLLVVVVHNRQREGRGPSPVVRQRVHIRHVQVQ